METSLLALVVAVTAGVVGWLVLLRAAARRPRVIALMYHRVCPRAVWQRTRGPERIFSLPDDALDEQLGWLAASGHRFVSADEVVAHARGERLLDDRSVLFTVDDGCASGHRHILPALRRHAARGIFFVTADPTSAVFESGGPDERRMSDEELREIVAAGSEIGSHALTHRPLSALSDDEVRFELAESKRRLEDACGASVRHFAVPANFFDARVLRIAREVGYASVFCSRPGVIAAGAGAMPIPRLNVDGDLDLAGFQRALSPSALATRRLVLALRALPKRVVGPRAWLLVRRTLLRGPVAQWLSPRRMARVAAALVGLATVIVVWRWLSTGATP